MINNTILITGAAGNLGGLLANSLQERDLHLITHKKEVSQELKSRSNIKIFKADLDKKETLYPATSRVFRQSCRIQTLSQTLAYAELDDYDRSTGI